MLPATEKRKTAESFSLTMHNHVCVVGRTQQEATDDTIAWHPGVTGYAGGENQRMLYSILVYWYSLTDFWHDALDCKVEINRKRVRCYTAAELNTR